MTRSKLTGKYSARSPCTRGPCSQRKCTGSGTSTAHRLSGLDRPLASSRIVGRFLGAFSFEHGPPHLRRRWFQHELEEPMCFHGLLILRASRKSDDAHSL